MKIVLLLHSMDTMQLLDKNTLTISLTDDVKYVKDQMNITLSLDLPVLDGDRFVGFISHQDLLDVEDAEQIGSLRAKIKPLPTVSFSTHWYDLLREMKKNQQGILAVVEGEKYIGLINAKSLINALGNNSSIQMPGTIIVLEIKAYDYMLSRIAQITEERNVKIMCLNVESIEESPFMKLHLKLNTHEIEGISRELERYGFHILETHQENSAYQEDIMENYDALMKYLGV